MTAALYRETRGQGPDLVLLHGWGMNAAVWHGLPADLALGGQYKAKTVLAVLRHLAVYWAEQPPLRQHARHPGKSRLFALLGFANCVAALGPEASTEALIRQSLNLLSSSLTGGAGHG